MKLPKSLISCVLHRKSCFWVRSFSIHWYSEHLPVLPVANSLGSRRSEGGIPFHCYVCTERIIATGNGIGGVDSLWGRPMEKMTSGEPFWDHFLEFSGSAGKNDELGIEDLESILVFDVYDMQIIFIRGKWPIGSSALDSLKCLSERILTNILLQELF